MDDRRRYQNPSDIDDVINAHMGVLPTSSLPAPDPSIKVELADGTSIFMTKNEYLAYRLGLANQVVEIASENYRRDSSSVEQMIPNQPS